MSYAHRSECYKIPWKRQSKLRLPVPYGPDCPDRVVRQHSFPRLSSLLLFSRIELRDAKTKNAELKMTWHQANEAFMHAQAGTSTTTDRERIS